MISIMALCTCVVGYLYNDYIKRWAITQYGDAQAGQSTFYTFQNKKGELIVIDGGLSDEFYELVKPKIAFFDAPDWLMFDETGKYDNPQNAELMRSMGSEIYSFSTAPNQIILK